MISVQTIKSVSLKKVLEIVDTIPHFSQRYNSKNYVAVNHDLFISWNSKSRMLVILKSDNSIVPELQKPNRIDFNTEVSYLIKLDNFELEQTKYYREHYNNRSFDDFLQKDHKIRQNEIELNSLKLITKTAKPSTKINCSLIFEQLKKQNDSDIKAGLLIHEKFTNHVWFVYKIYEDGTAMCFANLNAPEFAEFGSVRFSDITTAHGLETGCDDNDFVISYIKDENNNSISFNRIRELCNAL